VSLPQPHVEHFTRTCAGLECPGLAELRKAWINLDDPSALNGLGSVFIMRRDLDAAEFYIRQSVSRARDEGFDYPEAAHDLRLIESLKKAKKHGTRAVLIPL
jgi:hypothetical protein